MSAPLSLDRVKAMLRRLSPSWPSTSPDTSVGKELDSIAVPLGMAADVVDTTLDESFPDTADRLLDRWEKVARVTNKGDQDIDARRARVLAVLRRTSGPRLAQLEVMLAGPFDLSIDDIIFYEGTRELIEDALTEILTPAELLTAAVPFEMTFRKPWPGEVDDFGVRVYIRLDTLPTGATATVTSPAGTVWTFDLTAVEATYWNRDDFEEEVPAGAWTVSVTDPAGGSTLEEVRFLVSNDVDSAQIYNFSAYRDPGLAGEPDISEAQRLFGRTAHGHLDAKVIQSVGFTVDDEFSLVDRDLVGI